MRVLIIGSGGREHALARSLARSARSLFIAPGNAGTGQIGQNVPIEPDDIEGLVSFAQQESIQLTVVGPEAPLVHGVSDAFEACRLPVVGPSSAAAEIEGSKAFAKAFMERHGIPTAAHRTFAADQFGEASAYVREAGAPIVVKASGLAAGKGVMVCATMDEALGALDRVLRTPYYADTGREVVVESYMEGEEASVFALTDGEDYAVLVPAQDHKRVGEGDTGPNTGGMGAYAPTPVAQGDLLADIRRRIIEPTLEGMASEGRLYKGCLYAGIMVTPEGPKVVEFNCRLGDPEAQVVLPLLDVDLVEALQRLTEGRLGTLRVTERDGAAACVVLSSCGYPGPYQKGLPISGLDAAGELQDVEVFHSGTRLDSLGRILTAGGRVLGVTAIAADLPGAVQRAYEAVDLIHFEGAHFRRDIGSKGLERMAT